MKPISLVLIAICSCTLMLAQGKPPAHDPLTGLPLYAEDSPIPMPGTHVCKSTMRGDFYKLSNIKLKAIADWYSTHLSGFKKSIGTEQGRTQIAFYNSDGSPLVIITGESDGQGENSGAYSISYQKYEPGLSENTIIGYTRGKMVCQ